MGLIWEILKATTDSNNNDKNKELEKEMDWYGLEKHEREAVKRGDYEPYNFEDSHDELDEDDYYYGDDE